MNDYEARQEARRERLLDAAARAERLSSAMYASAKAAADVIPFGQPILVGHHSERRDRAYRARFQRKFERSFELSKKAAELRAAAASVGNAGISSDDPDAVVKLKEELAQLEDKQRLMKLANATIRREKKNGEAAQLSAVMKVLNVSEAAARKLLEPDFCGRIGFPDYALKNNGANIRRIEARIAQLSRERAAATDVERELEGGIRYREDVTENRVMLMFPGKPDERVRDILKSNGFRWSPSRGAWVRMLNNAGRRSAEYVLELIARKGAEVAA